MELRYKVIYGFDKEQEISIGADELEKAYALFLAGGRAIFKSGDAVDSKHIQAIRPDYHGTMGWTIGHRLGPDDYNELSDTGVEQKLKITQAKAKERVDYLIAHGQHDLIGKNVKIPELEFNTQTRGGAMKSIADLMPKHEKN